MTNLKVFQKYIADNYKVDLSLLSANDMEKKKDPLLQKYIHTICVAFLSKVLADRLELNSEQIKLAETIGIFHDLGRFEQWKQYHNFVDKDSINHAKLSAEMLFGEKKLIKKFNVDAKYYDLIRFAVESHSQMEINKEEIEKIFAFPQPISKEEFIMQAQIIRDTDKMDIFRQIKEGSMPTRHNEHINPYEDNMCVASLNSKQGVSLDSIKGKRLNLCLFRLGHLYNLNFKKSLEIIGRNEDNIDMSEMGINHYIETIKRLYLNPNQEETPYTPFNPTSEELNIYDTCANEIRSHYGFKQQKEQVAQSQMAEIS